MANDVKPPLTWRECAMALSSVAAGGWPEDLEQSTMYQLLSADLLVRGQQYTACKTCGVPRATSSYWRITPAGRLLIQALEQQ